LTLVCGLMVLTYSVVRFNQIIAYGAIPDIHTVLATDTNDA